MGSRPSHSKAAASRNLADSRARRDPGPFRKCPWMCGRHRSCLQSILVLWPEVGSSSPQGSLPPFSGPYLFIRRHWGQLPGEQGPCAWGRPPLFVLRQVTTPCPDFTESF